MLPTDPFPFGKYKGTPIGEVDPSYITWLKTTEWFTADGKWGELYVLLSPGGATKASTPKERQVFDDGKDILAGAPPGFPEWWSRAYGERLRRDGQDLYIPYLRVSLDAWHAAIRPTTLEPQKPTSDKVPY